MTPEEKQVQMNERNALICAYYKSGRTLRETASRFQLGRQRTQQILEAGGVWRPYEKGKRTRHLGVTVSDETKAALTRKAVEQGVSVSKMVSDELDRVAAK